MTSMIIWFVNCDGWYAPYFNIYIFPSVNHSIWSKCDAFMIEVGVKFTFCYHKWANCTWNSIFTGECVAPFYYTCYQWLNHKFDIISVCYGVCNVPTYFFHVSDESFNNFHMFIFSIYFHQDSKKVLCYVKLIIFMNDGYIETTCIIFV